jgi:prepilin-type N-terminal cleavage/methylation domain-containing protein
MMRRSSKGFTLIEVLIAMAIMIIGLLAFWNMHVSATKSDAFSSRMSKAVFYAEQELEDLKSATFSTLSNGDYSDTVTDGPVTFVRKWTISDYSASLSSTKQVDITVGWGGSNCSSASDDVNNCTHKVQLETVITDSSNL